MIEEKLLCHIVSKEGTYTYPNWDNSIKEIPLPTSKKDVQSFFTKIDFLRRFIPNFSYITLQINKLLIKGANFK